MFTLHSVENHRIIETFRRAADRNQSTIDANNLVAHVSEFQGCPVLKIDKPHWHNRGEVDIPGEIFFSIWVGTVSRINYNIHALKLRHLTAYRLQSRDFATAFRASFNPAGWPNISTDFGPQTLMQGWIPDDGNLDELIVKFVETHQLIDELLKEKMK